MRSSNHESTKAPRGTTAAKSAAGGGLAAPCRRIHWCSRGQRGYALISAVMLAVLYFGLMELMLIDSSRALREAQRFRARLLAATIAENAAELAARQMVTAHVAHVTYEDWQGTAVGDLRPSSTGFDIMGDATVRGTVPAHASVLVQASIDSTKVPPVIHIDFTRHSQ